MPGRLFGIGVGPGNPELMTLKAARLIKAAPVIAYFAKRGSRGQARAIVDGHLAKDVIEEALIYPVTTEIDASSLDYQRRMTAFYDAAAARLAAHLDRGRDVAVISEGDPFLYGSFAPLFHRLSGRYHTHVVPGVPAMAGGWTQAGQPIAYGDDVLVVLPATLPVEKLRAHVTSGEALVIMKIGRHFSKIKTLLEETGLAARAIYVERATMTAERVLPLQDVTGDVPYFSIVLVPGEGRRL